MTREATIEHSLDYFDNGSFKNDLSKLIEIPTESQVKTGVKHCLRYLNFSMVPAFESMGFKTKIYENPILNAGPILLATRIEGPDLPTVLGYGHGDVILGFDESWTKGNGPWKATQVGDLLYGRGTADNKSQHWINMSALRSLLSIRGNLGFNAKFIIETSEENGSKGLREVISSDLSAFSVTTVPTDSIDCVF